MFTVNLIVCRSYVTAATIKLNLLTKPIHLYHAVLLASRNFWNAPCEFSREFHYYSNLLKTFI